MYKRYLFACLLLVVALIAGYSVTGYGLDYSDVFKSSNPAVLTRGWDLFGEPLAYGDVMWQIVEKGNSPNNLQVAFQLKGAKPNHSYTVGVHLFNKCCLNQKPCYNQFGGYAVGGEGVITRENKTAWTTAYDFGQVNTDGNGNGYAQFNLSVPSGIYFVQFTVRIGGIGTCLAFRGITHGCAAAYRTGNRFADKFEEITIQ